jgi:hypothetical protein
MSCRKGQFIRGTNDGPWHALSKLLDQSGCVNNKRQASRILSALALSQNEQTQGQ